MSFPVILIAIFVVMILSVVLRRERHRRRTRVRDDDPRPVDLAPWRTFAAGMDLKLSGGRLPRMHGLHDGNQFRIQRLWALGSRTRARVRVAMPRAHPGKLRVRPRGKRARTDFERRTGDEVFDGEFRVQCFTHNLAEEVLTDEVRAWIRALGDVDLEVSGRVATAEVPGFESDLDRLRALLELSRAVAVRMKAAAPQ